jgi:lysozyme
MQHESLFFIFQMLLVLLVLIALMQYVNNVASDTGFNKRFVSTDLGLLMTVLSSAPGTVVHHYMSVQFPAPLEVDFSSSIITITEVSKPLKSQYWFLSDLNMDVVAFLVRSKHIKDLDLSAYQTITGEPASVNVVNMTFFKSPGRIKDDEKKVNPLQLACPSFNTSDPFWDRSKKVLVAKILSSKNDFADADLPINRVAQILSAQSAAIIVNVPTKGIPKAQPSSGPSEATSSGGSASSQPAPFVSTAESSETVSAQDSSGVTLPSPEDFKLAEMTVLLGDTKPPLELKGALRIYMPAGEDNSMVSRKLACIIMNKILAPSTEVAFVQVVPVFKDSLDPKSPLRGLFAPVDKAKPVVFIDLGAFAASELNVDNVAYAVFNGIHRYYDSNKSIVLTAPPIVVGGAPALPGGSTPPAQTTSKPGSGGGTDVELKPGAEGIYTLALKGGDPYIRAYMRAITVGEGTSKPTAKCSNPYHIIVGGECFDGDKHPEKVVRLTPSLSSSAAGRYQFLTSSWKGWAAKYSIPYDQFTPENQDKVVYKVLEGLKLDQVLAGGNLDAAFGKTNMIWASLPGSRYGQRTENRASFERFYNALLAEEKAAAGQSSEGSASPPVLASNSPSSSAAPTSPPPSAPA